MIMSLGNVNHHPNINIIFGATLLVGRCMIDLVTFTPNVLALIDCRQLKTLHHVDYMLASLALKCL